jgi:lysophospholipid acyltransferase (LPLAT)-like uncharacterized protein
MSQTDRALPPAKSEGTVARWRRRREGSEWIPRTLAWLVFRYMQLVQATSRVIYEPGNPLLTYRDQLPGIGTLWHGTQFMLAPIRPPDVPVRILISNHRDGEVTARIAAKFGAGTVRGSRGRAKSWLRKGGVSAFLELQASLDEGHTVILTADATFGTARRAGLGPVALARASGKAIVGIGVAASRRIVINSWDRAIVPLPFSRIAIVATPVIRVPADATETVMEEKRRELEDALNAATDRASQIAARRQS